MSSTANVLERRHLNESVRASIAAATGRPCFLVVVPEDVNPTLPYSILYPIAGGGFSGSYDLPDRQPAVVYQLTSVGGSTNQAEWMGDRVRKAFLGRNDDAAFLYPISAPAGWTIMQRSSDSGAGGVDPGEGGLYSIAERFVIWLTRV